ncbi:hypothetical protein H4R35_006440 [Dimargaris xerosporica]|nr:hypothetical protein H4R35_006440 [Dimargaris xerosporica]
MATTSAPLYSKRQENKLDVDIQYGVVATVNLFPGSQRMYGIVPSAPVALATDIHTLLHALFVGTMVKVVGSIQVVKCIGDVDQKDMLTAFGHFFTMLMTPGLHKGYLPFYHFGPQYSGHGLTFYELTWNANPYEASGVFEPRVPRALYDLPRPSTSSWFKMLLMVYGVLMKYFPVSDTWHPEKPLRSANTLMLMIMLTSAKALPCSPTIFDVAKALLEATALLSASEIAEQVCAVLEGLGVVRATV